MAVIFVNAAAQPILNQEVLVATIAGPLDDLDAYIQAPAWADGFLAFFVYATVGGVRAKVATSLYQGPKAGRLTWEVGTNPAAAPVHAGGTSYDLVVFAQATQNSFLGALSPSQPPAIAATFAGVNASDVVADANVSNAVLVGGGGETTVTTAAGFNQAADVSANLTNLPSLDFRLYASCGAGSVEALIDEKLSQGADGITSVMRGVVLPVATQYRLAVAQARPGGAAVNVTASLSTYQNVSGGGGGVGVLTGNVNGPSNANLWRSFTVVANDGDVLIIGTLGWFFIRFVNLSANRNLVLPAAPLDGEVVVCKDGDGSLALHNIVIQGNGQTIDGAATYTMTAATNGIKGAVSLQFDANAPNPGWFVF